MFLFRSPHDAKAAVLKLVRIFEAKLNLVEKYSLCKGQNFLVNSVLTEHSGVFPLQNIIK